MSTSATVSRDFLERWHHAVASRSADDLGQLLAEDVSMGAPPHWRRLEGRPVVHALLDIIIDTIEDFTYHREWLRDGELALEFTGRIGQLELQGIDLISLDQHGRVRMLDVLVRPLNALDALQQAVAPRMAERLAAGPSSSA